MINPHFRGASAAVTTAIVVSHTSDHSIAIERAFSAL